ncbi:MAG: rare lipoprotein [Acidimicrobiaceae bacterium]|nr:rare lipoprotein [Acidimicrobiaceae bacterium]
MEDTEANVVAAQLEHDRLSDKASAVRQRVRARAVRAYIHGTGLGSSAATDLAAPSVYLEVTARKERELLTSLRTASAAAAQREDQADQARQGLRAVAVDLDRARAELDRLVAADDAKQLAARVAAEEAASQQAAADARRRAVAAAARSASDALGQARAGGADGSGLLPRHREATRRQADVMQRHPFGVLPAGPLPNAIAPTGEQFSGQASWYGPGFNGRPTASGAIYDEDGWTAASRTLPLGTLIVVSRNGVRVLLLVNDRGPYVDGRVLDLSAAAARALGVGVSQVDVEVVAPANGRL